MVRSALLSLALAASLVGRSEAAAQPMTLADLRSEISFGAVEMAPDGRHIAVIERRSDRAGTKRLGTLVLIDRATQAAATLVRDLPDMRSASWSPDGSRLAFIATPRADTVDPKSTAHPVPELFVVAARGGDPERLTTTKTGVNDARWRPDGRALAFASEDEAPNKAAIEGHDDAFDITDAAWNEREAKLPVHLYELVLGHSARRLTTGEATLAGGFTYTGDGRAIVFARAPRPSNHYRAARLARVDVRTGTVTTIAAAARSTDPRFSPTGRALAYVTEHPQAPSQSDIIVAAVDGAHGVPVSRRLDRNASLVDFAPNGQSVLVAANDGTRSRLFDLAIDGSSTTGAMRYPGWDGNVSDVGAVARDGSVAFVGSTPVGPPEIYVAAAHAALPTRVTNLNARLASRRFGATTTVAWRSRDGFAADGVLTAPVHYAPGRRYPLVLVIHGGPTATSTTSLDTLAQLLAAHDFFVFQPNYRGSDNAGWRWAQATVPHITSAPGADVEEGLATVLKRADIDPKRIGVSGWSEGGLMTSWLITHDTRWKSAMSGAAVNDWTWYAAMTDAQDFSPSFIGPSPWTSPTWRALYDAESPLTYAARVRTPTLIMSDVGDQRVPEPLAYAFYHEIRATGTPVKLLMIPVDGHFPRDPARSEMVLGRWVDWFAKTL